MALKEKYHWLKVNFQKMYNYRHTIRYLYKQRGIKAVYNFLFVKLVVKEGEGSWGVLFYLLRPLLLRFPKLIRLLTTYPYNLEMEITTICNKKCILCEHTHWQGESYASLTFEQFKGIVDQFPKLKWVNLTGEGDAFLNKDYLRMIKYLKDKDIPLFLVDSFDRLDENIARQLIEMRVDGIWMSLDGATKETYEKIKVGCDFDRSIGNLKRMIELKKEMNSPIPELCFRYIISTLNVHEMPKFVDFIHSLGDPKWLGDGTVSEYVGLLWFEEIKQYFLPEVPCEIEEATRNRARELGVQVKFSHAGKLPPLESCTAWFEPYIMMGGHVLSCCQVLMSNKRPFLREHCLGNVYEKSFRDIWYSERYKKFRQMIPDKNCQVPILCQGCRAYDTSEREAKFGVSKDV